MAEVIGARERTEAPAGGDGGAAGKVRQILLQKDWREEGGRRDQLQLK